MSSKHKPSAAEKKSSVVSRYSILSTSRSSIGSLPNTAMNADTVSISPGALTSPSSVMASSSSFSAFSPNTKNAETSGGATQPSCPSTSSALRSVRWNFLLEFYGFLNDPFFVFSTTTAYSNVSYSNTSSSTTDGSGCCGRYGSDASTLTTTVSTIAGGPNSGMSLENEQKLSSASEAPSHPQQVYHRIFLLKIFNQFILLT